ncbi:N-acetyltransferase [Pseudocitrobacter cyperus]|uniref:N-acetyltransferase n=1 Tax=Pseudocitrobacter cyperus TaxID=3112843 RepID=A0ABV0HPC3_9ENTR
MIGKWTAKSLDPLLTLWLESTTFAHPFIDEQYWHDSLALVRDVYLPAADTWVWEEDDALLGFISVMDNQFIGALFVAPQALHRGIGSELLNHVKQRYPDLSLEVYQKNDRAVNFYHALGFRIEDGAWQEDTKHPTWIMRWQADQTPLA